MPPDPSHAELEAWRGAQTLAELCELTARFLEGRIAFFPGWLAADVDEETDALVPTLAGFNRAGLMTLASQPGRAPHAGFGGHTFSQRAFVAGFAPSRTAAALDALVHGSELVVSSYLATDGGGCRIPVGRRDDAVTAWAGHAAGPEELAIFAEVLSPAALGALEQCRYVSIVDPAWEERGLLWEAVSSALREDAHDGTPGT